MHAQLVDFPFSYQATDDPDMRRAFLRCCCHTVYFRVVANVVEIYAVLPSNFGSRRIESRDLKN